MTNSKIIFGILSLAFGFAIYIPYAINMWKRVARPHIFSWITWTIIPGLAFVISFSNGGGLGSWLFALQGTFSLLVVIYSIFLGEKKITVIDWISFLSALVVAVFYIFTKQAVLSVILATVIDSLGYVPTFRKSFSKPFEEPALTYLFSSLGNAAALGAVGIYSAATIIYPAVMVLINAILVGFLLYRRREVKI